jgi:hypothetical protein
MTPHKSFPPGKRQNLLPVIGASTLLTILICACNFASRLPGATSQPDMTSWRKTESPLFPVNWPPTSDTVWVSYTFAYGSDPATLMDGAYVTSPLSKTEWKDDTSTTTALNSEMKQATIQGVVPLDDETNAILEAGPQVSKYCLKLTALPDLATSGTKDMLVYYQTWFKYNGAFLDLIRNDHVSFIEWVEQNK